MRKILLIAASLLMTISMMAAGNNSGSTKANAIDFDWTNGNVHESSKALWYRVDMSNLTGMIDPTLALYLTNLTDQNAQVDVTVTATVTIMGQSQTETQDLSYKLNPKDYKIFSKNVKQLLDLNVKYLFLTLKADKKIALSAKKYETSDIVDEACTKAKDFNWSGVTVPAGETWYRLNLTQVRAQGDELNFVVANNGSAAKVNFDLSLDCPASAVFSYKWDIAAGAQMIEEFGRIFIDELNDDYVYLKLTTDQPLTLSVEQKPAPPALDETWTVSESLAEGQVYTLAAGEQVFEVELAALKAPRGYKSEFVITNNTSVPANFKKEISFVNPVQSVITKELVVPANGTVTKDVVNNLSSAISSEYAYVRFTTDQELTIKLQYTLVNSDIVNDQPVVEPTCENSLLFDWNSTIEQKAFVTKWYELDIAPLKQNKEQVQLSFTNNTEYMAVVVGSILLDCSSTDTIPYVCPVPAGKTINQVLEYSLLAAAPLGHAYVSAMVIPTTIKSLADLASITSVADIKALASTDLDASVQITATKTSALVDPTACEAAVTLQNGVEYTQTAGTTKWYHVTDEFLKDELGLLSSFAFENKGSKAANVTFGITVGCEYGIVTKMDVAVPTWLDFNAFYPNGVFYIIDKVVNSDVKEFYLEVTTDQDVAFGFGLDKGTTLGCENAISFDWSKGVTVAAKNPTWYEIDITDIKADEQQVKLTFTNKSESIAWVAAMVTYDCPFKAGLPLMFPVPAGVSVDKWIDYSFFKLAPLDKCYMAVYTTDPIEVKAQKESAVITPVGDCVNATEVKPAVEYTVAPGTHWYKFANATFQAAKGDPKFTFSHKSDKRAHVTVGATVGCEYGILTKGKLILPDTLAGSVTVPREVMKVTQWLIGDGVEEIYLQVTTDDAFKFKIDLIETDTTIVPEQQVKDYWCAGTEYTYTDPTDGKDKKVFLPENTPYVELYKETVPTADPLVKKEITYVLKPLAAPQTLTSEDLKKIYAGLDSLTPGVVPALDKQKLLDYYAELEKNTEGVAKATGVEWTTQKVDCGATTWKITFNLTTECDGVEIPYEITLPVKKTRTKTYNETICEGGEGYKWVDGDGEVYKTAVTKKEYIKKKFDGSDCAEILYVLTVKVLEQPAELTEKLFKELYPAVDSLIPGTTPTFDGEKPTFDKNVILKHYENDDHEKIAKVTGVKLDTEKIECGDETHTFKVILETATDCGDLITEITLPVKKTRTKTYNETICEGGEGYKWVDGDGEVYKTAVTNHEFVKKKFDGSDCAEILYVLTVKVLEQPAELTEELFKQLYSTVDSLIPGTTPTFDGEKPTFDKNVILKHYENDDHEKIAKVTGVKLDTEKIECGAETHTFKVILETATDCGDLITEITLPVKHTRTGVFNREIKQGDSYTWTEGNGKTYKTAVTGEKYTKNFEGSECLELDYTLNLKVIYGGIKEVTVVDTVCVGTEYQGRLSKKTINQYTEWKDSLRIEVAGVPVDSIYKYQIHTYVTGIPTLEADEVIAICGNAMDVKAAEATIQAYIDAEPYFAPVVSLVWEVLEGNEWKTMSTAALDGNVKTVTARFTLNTECKSMTSNEVTVNVETPTPENDYEMANIPAYNKYGGRLLTLDIKRIENDLGWNIDIADITWYRVVDQIDNYADETSVKNDEVVGHDYYLAKEDGSPLPAGTYYARVNHNRVTEADCDGIVQSVEVLVSGAEVGMKLAPTMAKPHEVIRLLNLNPEEDATVRVYSTTGEIMDTFEVKNATEASFHAAQTAGYYIVEVQTETGKVSLRYIVK